MKIQTGFKNSSNIDIGMNLVEKEYLMDRYPELVNTFKQAGLWTWGYNVYGQLGDNTVIDKSSPIQTIAGGTNWKQVSCGISHAAAIKTDGTLWLWGRNSSGGLGDSTVVDKSSPIQTIAGGANWKQVAAGGSYTAAIKTDGTLWLWGYNGNGCLGTNNAISQSSPVQTIAGGTNWKQVSCGRGHTAAIKADGTLWLWGGSDVGNLGNNNNLSQSSPVQTISAGTNWKQVSCGSSHTAAVKTDGTLWLWGSNISGQLGDNSTTNKSSPIQTISAGTNWKSVSCGYLRTAAIKTDGTLWVWGYGFMGGLGDGATADKSSPVQTIAGGTNWKQVSVGEEHVTAIKTDGTLWAWGHNQYGCLGNNTTTSTSSPIQTIASGTNWKSIACSRTYTIAIRDDSSDPI